MNHPIFAPAFGESSEHIIDLVAQLVEHFTFNERVPGSSPGQVTSQKPPFIGGFLFIFFSNSFAIQKISFFQLLFINSSYFPTIFFSYYPSFKL